MVITNGIIGDYMTISIGQMRINHENFGVPFCEKAISQLKQ
jgi:hypothetical protein